MSAPQSRRTLPALHCPLSCQRINLIASSCHAPFCRRRNTALHIAVLHCRNESYRYLLQLLRADRKLDRRVELIGPSFRNSGWLTPVQLAAKGGERCTQARPLHPDEPAGP